MRYEPLMGSKYNNLWGFASSVKMEFHLLHFDTADHLGTFTTKNIVFSVIFHSITYQ